MYIELIGLPGAGKTTLVNKLLELPELNDKLTNLAHYKSSILKKKSWKLNFFLFLVFNLVSLFHLTRKTLIGSSNKKQVLRRLSALYVLLFVLKQFNNSNRILLMDQSIIQMLVSIFIYNKKPKEFVLSDLLNRCLHIVKTDTSKYFKIGVEISLEEAVNRIKSRAKKDCGFKTMGEIKRDAVLQKYNYYFGFIGYDFVCYTKEPLDTNIQKLHSFINCHL